MGERAKGQVPQDNFQPNGERCERCFTERRRERFKVAQSPLRRTKVRLEDFIARCVWSVLGAIIVLLAGLQQGYDYPADFSVHNYPDINLFGDMLRMRDERKDETDLKAQVKDFLAIQV